MKESHRFSGILGALIFAVLLSQCPFSALGQNPNNATTSDNSTSAKVTPAALVPDEKGIYKIGGPVSAPKLIRVADPKISDEARRAKLSGICVVGLLIDTEGKPRNVHIIEPLEKGLDESAIKAVQQWRFKPSMYDGKPVQVETKVEVHFGVG
jgi:TonB family protein